MTNKSKTSSAIKFAIVALVIVVCALGYSYANSKKVAESFVGASLKYFQVSGTRLTVTPIDNKIAWAFEFSQPEVFDAEFEVYISLLGDLVLTNPTDLDKRLKSYEKAKVHPYSVKK